MEWTEWNLSMDRTTLDPSIFQESSMRFSSIQIRMSSSGYINVFQWNWNDSFLGEQSLTLGSTWWRWMKFPDMDQKSFITSIRKWVVRWCPGKSMLLSLNWSRPYQGGCSQVLISSKRLDSSICDWKNKFSFFFGEYHLFRNESFWVDFRCVHRL